MTDQALDDLVRRVLLDVYDQEYGDVIEELPEHDLSPAFEKKMKKLIRRADHPIRYRVVQAAACLVLAALLSGCTVLAFAPEARTAFFSWVRTQYENIFVYHFSGPDIDTDLPTYTLGWLPEGYVETSRVQEDTVILCTYSGPDGGIIFFRYSPMSDNIIDAVTTNGVEPEAVVINSMAGDFYLSDVASESNELIWFDQNANIAFSLSSFFDKTVMIHIAQSVFVESFTN